MAINIRHTTWSVKRWEREIGALLDAGDDATPIVNINDKDDREFDAIFLGGGASGRFGSAYLRARGGRQLVIDRWPFLGGSCPHQACATLPQKPRRSWQNTLSVGSADRRRLRRLRCSSPPTRPASYQGLFFASMAA